MQNPADLYRGASSWFRKEGNHWLSVHTEIISVRERLYINSTLITYTDVAPRISQTEPISWCPTDSRRCYMYTVVFTMEYIPRLNKLLRKKGENASTIAFNTRECVISANYIREYRLYGIQRERFDRAQFAFSVPHIYPTFFKYAHTLVRARLGLSSDFHALALRSSERVRMFNIIFRLFKATISSIIRPTSYLRR